MSDTVVFITHQMGTQGSYLNHLDLQEYIKNDHNIRFYCEDKGRLLDTIKNTRRDYKFGDGEVFELQKEIVEYESVITDFKSLLMLHSLNYFVICRHLLVMDSIELTYSLKGMKNARFYVDKPIDQIVKQIYADKITFLMPPCNYRMFKDRYPKIGCQIFFKNINTEILDTLKFENRNGYFFRWDDCKGYDIDMKNRFGENGHNFEPDWKMRMGRKIPLKYNEVDHLFDYKTLVYRRRKYLEYQEQFGRLIFEYILLGKTVIFAEEPYKDDGLTDYLKHFEIKFDDNNKVITTKDELREKMKTYEYKPWEE
jgi:hypothetical protein